MNARTMAIAAIAAHFAGCAPVGPPAQAQVEPQTPVLTRPARVSEADALLSYFDSTRALTKDELKGELITLQRRVLATPTNYLRLQLAMVLSAPHAETRDLPQALKLLEDVLKDTEAPTGGARSLAALLQGHLALSTRQEENLSNLAQRVKDERRRAEQAQVKQDGSAQLEQKLKDEQRRYEVAAAKHDEAIQQLQAKLRDEQKRSEELQQKLDALMRIEKSLIDRQQQQEAPKEPK